MVPYGLLISSSDGPVRNRSLYLLQVNPGIQKKWLHLLCLGLDNTFFEHKIVDISYSSVLTYVLGDQKNRLIETILLITHNICLG